MDHSSDYDSLPDPHPVEPEPEDVIEDLIDYVLDQVIYQVAQHEDFILDCNVTLHSSGPWENLEDMVHLADAVVEQEQEAVEQQPIAAPLPEVVEQPIPVVGHKRRRSERLVQKMFKIKRENL